MELVACGGAGCSLGAYLWWWTSAHACGDVQHRCVVLNIEEAMEASMGDASTSLVSRYRSGTRARHGVAEMHIRQCLLWWMYFGCRGSGPNMVGMVVNT
jgi:hypothetical protein